MQLGPLLHCKASLRPGDDCKKQVPFGPSCEHLQLTASTTVTVLAFFFRAYVLPSDPFKISHAGLKLMTFPRIVTPGIFRVEAWRPLAREKAGLHATRSNVRAMSNLFMWLSFRLAGKSEKQARSPRCARSNLTQAAASPRACLMAVGRAGKLIDCKPAARRARFKNARRSLTPKGSQAVSPVQSYPPAGSE